MKIMYSVLENCASGTLFGYNKTEVQSVWDSVVLSVECGK